MWRSSSMALCLGLFTTTAGLAADASDRAIIQSQVAAVLASVDYAAENCPALRIDNEKLAALIVRSGKTEEQLRATEEFAGQDEVLGELADNQSVETLCWILHQAHGGYVRGVIAK